ncbi:DMT family transporter [Streptomyces hoynatensis]|uniref:DMT family transporter n=1 Tax=Streptomyces hoynatensis TaxID=1141874 RepID=A0A3A9ZC16_9ACTN|nr:DMT family transporter [Streptomyces hoynatensis]RKN45861.1 DMT family transporter [Streptomyces hoynatensis]
MSPRGWLLFASMCLIWGVPYLMIKVALDGVSVPMVVFGRTAIGALLLLPLAARELPALRRHAVPIVLFAACEIIGPWLLLSDAERHLSSSMSGLLLAAVPVIALVVSRLTGGEERIGPRRLAGLGVGLAGVAVLAGPQLGGSAWAVTEVLLVALGYATAPLIAARRLREVPTLPLTAACLSLAALLYATPAALTWPAEVPEGKVLASLAGLGVLCTALGFLCFFELIREVGSSRAVVITYVNPAVAVAAGVLFLDEPLGVGMICAFALILTGSVLATGGPRPAAARAAAHSAAPAAGNASQEARNASQDAAAVASGGPAAPAAPSAGPASPAPQAAPRHGTPEECGT